jgi:hypothetical protein
MVVQNARPVSRPMSRASFLKGAGLAAAGVAAAGLGLSGVASAAPKEPIVPESVAGGGNNYNVWPTGDPETDVSNVQWAIDNVRKGGFVRLKTHDKFTGQFKAFNFGAPGPTNGFIRIRTQGVQIIGEKLPGAPLADAWEESSTYNQDFITPEGLVKSDRTMIWGGGQGWIGKSFNPVGYAIGVFNTFVTHPDHSFGTDPYDFSVQGIRFKNYGCSAVSAQASGPNGISVQDNVITDINLPDYDIGYGGFMSLAFGGIAGIPATAIMNIKNNMIIFNGMKYPGSAAIAPSGSSKSIIMDNVITGYLDPLPSGSGTIGIGSFAMGAGTEIIRNEISLKNVALSLMCFNGTNIKVDENYIVADTVNTFSMGFNGGIIGQLFSSEIKSNTIEVTQRTTQPSNGIGLAGNNTIVTGNTISGSGNCAIGLNPAVAPSNYTIEGNNFVGYAGNIAIILGGKNHTVTEPTLYCSRILNLGTNNCVNAKRADGTFGDCPGSVC